MLNHLASVGTTGHKSLIFLAAVVLLHDTCCASKNHQNRKMSYRFCKKLLFSLSSWRISALDFDAFTARSCPGQQVNFENDRELSPAHQQSSVANMLLTIASYRDTGYRDTGWPNVARPLRSWLKAGKKPWCKPTKNSKPRAPVSHRQEHLQIQEDPLQGPGQERRPAQYAVCLE